MAIRRLPAIELTAPNSNGPRADEARPASAWKPKYSPARSGGAIREYMLRIPTQVTNDFNYLA